MAELDSRKRARLPDSSFAYIDSGGRRRLPINDESHVRNALARFSRTRFESEGARETARRRLVRAARRHGIVPLGFLDGQLRSQRRLADVGRLAVELGGVSDVRELERRLRASLGDASLTVVRWSDAVGAYLDANGSAARLPEAREDRVATTLEREGRPFAALVHARSLLSDQEVAAAVIGAVRLSLDHALLRREVDARIADVRALPTGTVTFLMTDIEGSTRLLHRLGERYADVLEEVRSIIREGVTAAGGREVDARADEFFAAFGSADGALSTALAVVRQLAARAWPGGERVRIRAGIHTGRPTLTDTGYVGIAVHTVARVSAAGHGGQILLSDAAAQAVAAPPPDVTLRRLGPYRLRGIPAAHVLHQVAAADLRSRFPPLRASARLAGR
ncbi:MAG TPA: adenylate/guanylate cyclase domain-containing protein [Candidatus Limnocylindrales bacterium]|nr:adenylate/guanylate cyclase domain-containing protein [Candidatus Limnocylindrales bacterium]